MKRRIVLLRCLSRTTDAIEALIDLLGASPTDIEAWAELSDLYVDQGMFSQAMFCHEEILLVAPNAWNVRGLPLPEDRRFANRTVRCTHVWAKSYTFRQYQALIQRRPLQSPCDAFAGVSSFATDMSEVTTA